MGWQPIFFNLFDLKYQLSINIIANEREREREREFKNYPKQVKLKINKKFDKHILILI